MFVPPVVPPINVEELPDEVRRIIGSAVPAPITMGFSGDGVYDCNELILKTSVRVERLRRECDVMRWLAGKLPVSEVLYFGTDDGTDKEGRDLTAEQLNGAKRMGYLVTTKLDGQMAQAAGLSGRATAGLLAEALELLHSVDITGCPFDSSLDLLMKRARELVEAGEVSMQDWEKDTPFQSPEELLVWLEANRPANEETCFIHSDFCLPNIFLEDNPPRVSGFCDLGGAGVGDRWFDLALCTRSMGYNRVDDNVGWLFERLGLPFDIDRIRFYIRLDELF